MCDGREHRYRVSLTISGIKHQDVVVYAVGIGAAIAKADGFAHANFPDTACTFVVHRTGYSDDLAARAHGAII